jgi:hypothetical protein
MTSTNEVSGTESRNCDLVQTLVRSWKGGFGRALTRDLRRSGDDVRQVEVSAADVRVRGDNLR